MIQINNLSINFSGVDLFKDVDIMFAEGNCYGVIGANGAGKSTFLKMLSGEIEPSTGNISIKKDARMSVLKQNHFEFDEYSVLDTIIMGNEKLYNVMKEKDAIYMKEDFSDEDGIRASELEGEFAELDGWNIEVNAQKLLKGLGLDKDLIEQNMSTLSSDEKVKILLARALFGSPEIILLDEPTNHLDIESIAWLEDFIMDYEGTVIVVSHDRHFLNTVCTNIVDIDYGKVKMYAGNYEFWYESSQLIQNLTKNQNKKQEEKIKELQAFIQRFSANKSKSKQATSRRKLLDKIQIEDMPASTRRSPYVGFTIDRECGKEILTVENLTYVEDGVTIFENLSFRVNKDDKIAFVGDELKTTCLFKILSGELTATSGEYKWGVSISMSYFPKDNNEYFENSSKNIVEWLRQYSSDESETFLRGFLGKMLFSGEEVYKKVSVLSGGERVRCMLSKMMMKNANVIMLDQPTNHLDLESITSVNNGLTAYKSVVLLSSHDHELLSTVSNRIIDLSTDKVKDYLLTYDEYLEKV